MGEYSDGGGGQLAPDHGFPSDLVWTALSKQGFGLLGVIQKGFTAVGAWPFGRLPGHGSSEGRGF